MGAERELPESPSARSEERSVEPAVDPVDTRIGPGAAVTAGMLPRPRGAAVTAAGSGSSGRVRRMRAQPSANKGIEPPARRVRRSARTPGRDVEEAARSRSTAPAVIRRTFSHKGRKKTPTVYDSKKSVPKIHGVKPEDLEKLAEDAHDYGAIENKGDAATALAQYAIRNAPPADTTPLEDVFAGHVTVYVKDPVEQNVWQGAVKMTFQVDWLQGKHDIDFMRQHTTVDPRKSDGSQMRLSKDRYRELAKGVPLALATQKLAAVFGNAEREKLDFSVMKTKQADNLYYEISAMWATLGTGSRHVLVYYHCFPEKSDEQNWR